MKKRLMLITAMAMVSLLAFTACSNDTKNNNAMNDEMKNDVMASDVMKNDTMTEALDDDAMDDDTMADDAMEKDDDSDHEPMMTNDGDMAEPFELMDLEGNTVSLDGLKGEKVYIKFWASWCSVCLSGLEELNEFSGETHDFKVLTIVSPDFNGEKSASEFKSWFDKQDADNLTVLMDEDGDVARAYGIRGYPTSAFIGSDGVLVTMYPGHLKNEIITEQFDNIY